VKQRETLQQLNEQRDSVIFPVCNTNFDLFKSRLKKVIEANFDPPVASTLEYSCDDQKFSIVLSYSSTLAGSYDDNCEDEDRVTGFRLQRVVEIDPAHPLTEQINAALKTHERLKNRHCLVQLLLNEHLGK